MAPRRTLREFVSELAFENFDTADAAALETHRVRASRRAQGETRAALLALATIPAPAPEMDVAFESDRSEPSVEMVPFDSAEVYDEPIAGIAEPAADVSVGDSEQRVFRQLAAKRHRVILIVLPSFAGFHFTVWQCQGQCFQ